MHMEKYKEKPVNDETGFERVLTFWSAEGSKVKEGYRKLQP